MYSKVCKIVSQKNLCDLKQNSKQILKTNKREETDSQ